MFNADAKRADGVNPFLERSALDPSELRVYRSKLSGRDRFGVIYGDYPSADEATADLARVAKIGRVSKPISARSASCAASASTTHSRQPP